DRTVTGVQTCALPILTLHAWKEPQLIAFQQQVEELHLATSLLAAVDFERVASCYTLDTLQASDLNTIFSFGGKSLWSNLKDPQRSEERRVGKERKDGW